MKCSENSSVFPVLIWKMTVWSAYRKVYNISKEYVEYRFRGLLQHKFLSRTLMYFSMVGNHFFGVLSPTVYSIGPAISHSNNTVGSNRPHLRSKWNNLIAIPLKSKLIQSNSPKTLSMALNVSSLSNKTFLINDLITEQKVNCMFLTETFSALTDQLLLLRPLYPPSKLYSTFQF